MATACVLMFVLIIDAAVLAQPQLTCLPQFYIAIKSISNDEIISVNVAKSDCNRLQINCQSNDALKPHVKSTFINGAVFANITWDWTKTDSDSKETVHLELHLKFYNSTDKQTWSVNDTCTVLKPSQGLKQAEKLPADSNVDCLNLIDRHGGYVSVQVRKHSGGQQISNCPQIRVLLNQKPCHLTSNKNCSNLYNFPVSIAKYRKQLCTCGQEIPSLKWSFTDNRRFLITFTNLPPFLESITVEIIDELDENNNYILPFNDVYDQKITFLTNWQFYEGNYSIRLFTNCQQPVSDIFKYGCGVGTLDIHYIRSFIYVPPEKSISNPNIYKIMLVIVGSVATSAILSLTIVTWFHFHRRPKRRNIAELQLSIPHIDNTKLNARGATAGMVCNKILLWYPDHSKHDRNVVTMQSVLSKSGINIINASSENHRDFVTLIGREYTDIVIVVSDDLCQMCQEILTPSKCDNTLNDVMEKLRCLTIEQPGRRDFTVHIVSMENEENTGINLVLRLFQVYQFILSTKNYFVYYIQDSNVRPLENSPVLARLVVRLMLT